MDTRKKIEELWRYLKIQDNEVLIVRVYNRKTLSDEYLMVNNNNHSLEISTHSCLPELGQYNSFRYIQQMDSDGKHIIPSVKQLIRDKQVDY